MDLYLNEREVGFDPGKIGFPSIQGCMAIVLVNGNGLFGFHNYGGSAPAAWNDRAAAFASYFDGHFLRGAGTRLYGVTYVDIRGYPAPARTNWIGELTAFAAALNFPGKIRGFNLSGSGIPPSAYVEFRKSGEKAEIWVKHWADADKTTGANTDQYNHKTTAPRGGVTVVENQNAQVVTNVNPAGLHHEHSTRLRQ